MSADTYVDDWNKPVVADIRCWLCSRPVYDPKEHRACLEKRPEYGDRLPIQYEILNTTDG